MAGSLCSLMGLFRTISSIVHVYGLRGSDKGSWHPAYDAFCQMQEPYAVTMENLQELTAVAAGRVTGIHRRNEMVFSYLLETFEKYEYYVVMYLRSSCAVRR